MSEPVAAEPLRYVFVPKARCPVCHSTVLRIYGKVERDDSTERYARCLNATCRHKFKIISE